MSKIAEIVSIRIEREVLADELLDMAFNHALNVSIRIEREVLADLVAEYKAWDLSVSIRIEREVLAD